MIAHNPETWDSPMDEFSPSRSFDTACLPSFLRGQWSIVVKKGCASLVAPQHYILNQITSSFHIICKLQVETTKAKVDIAFPDRKRPLAEKVHQFQLIAFYPFLHLLKTRE
jgi:hypothetical protein